MNGCVWFFFKKLLTTQYCLIVAYRTNIIFFTRSIVWDSDVIFRALDIGLESYFQMVGIGIDSAKASGIFCKLRDFPLSMVPRSYRWGLHVVLHHCWRHTEYYALCLLSQMSEIDGFVPVRWSSPPPTNNAGTPLFFQYWFSSFPTSRQYSRLPTESLWQTFQTSIDVSCRHTQLKIIKHSANSSATRKPKHQFRSIFQTLKICPPPADDSSQNIWLMDNNSLL